MSVTIKLTKSISGRKRDQIATAESLGLKKIGNEKSHPENEATFGKIRKIEHLIEVKKETE